MPLVEEGWDETLHSVQRAAVYTSESRRQEPRDAA